MSVSLLASISLGIAVLVAAASYLVPVFLLRQPRREHPVPVFAAVGLGALVILVVFVLALPTSPPFSAGQRLGFGVLIGGLLGLGTLVRPARLGSAGDAYSPYLSLYSLALALSALSFTLLLFSGNPADALLGCALGFGAIAGIGRVALAGGEGVHLEPAAVLVATLAAGSVLAVQRFPATAQRGWWAYPLLLAGIWLLGQAIGGSVVVQTQLRTRRPPLLAGLSAALAAVLTIVLGWLLASRLEPPQFAFPLLLVAVVTAGLLVWLAVAGATARADVRARSAALSALLVLFLVVLSFKLLHGVGTAIALVAAWGVAAAAIGLRVPAAPTAALALGANFLLLRVFLENSGSVLGNLDASLHYTLIGLVLGALLPVLYSSLHDRAGIGRAVALGFLTAVSPVIVLALWGPDAGVGMLAGLVIAPAIAAVLAPFALEGWAAPALLMALGMALIIVQFDRSLALLYEVPRAVKIYLAGGVALAVIAWLVGVGIASGRAPQAAQER